MSSGQPARVLNLEREWLWRWKQTRLIGPSCLLALAAILAERPVTLLASGESVLKVSSDLRNVTAVRDFELGNLRSEINSLIDRVDEQEFQFSGNTSENRCFIFRAAPDFDARRNRSGTTSIRDVDYDMEAPRTPLKIQRG